MSQYVSNLLSTVFATDFALTEEGIASHMNDPRMGQGTPLGDAIRSELKELYRNPDTDWVALVENDVYEVFPGASPEEARDFVTQRIWNVLFPEEKNNPPSPSARTQ